MELELASKQYVSKQNNSKTMFCPQKQIRMSEFARNIVNGLIWDDIKEEKVHPKVLYKMGLQQQLGLTVNRTLARDQKIQQLDEEIKNSVSSPKDGSAKNLLAQAMAKQMAPKKKEENKKDLFAVS